jgi:putative Holliday junction resolvase
MNYLGLDLGTKTVGIAISTSGIIASGLETIRFKEHDYLYAVNYIKDVIKRYEISVVVIGLPKHMNNDIGERAEHTYWFKEALQPFVAYVELFDERLSTKTAMKSLTMGKASIEKKKELKDTISAVVILQNYLNTKGYIK